MSRMVFSHTHFFGVKATNKFYNHFEDSTALIFMQEQNSQILEAMLLKKTFPYVRLAQIQV